MFFNAIAYSLLLIIAYFIEFHFHLEPCPLCLLQRYTFISLTLLSVAAWIHRPTYHGKIVYITLQLCFCLMGILLTLRHLWLQYLAPNDIVLSCTAGLDKLLQFQPIFDTLKEVIFHAEGCTEIDFTVLTLPLSAWSLFFFIGFFCYNSFILKLIIKRRV
jgi:disulfide bond formation protein DsbB